MHLGGLLFNISFLTNTAFRRGKAQGRYAYIFSRNQNNLDMTLNSKSNFVYQMQGTSGNHSHNESLLFIGYTEKQPAENPLRSISSLQAFEAAFGSFSSLSFQISPDAALDYRLQISGRGNRLSSLVADFLAQGNKSCQVLSLGSIRKAAALEDFLAVLPLLEKSNCARIMAPDAVLLSEKEQQAFRQALQQATQKKGSYTTFSPVAMVAEPPQAEMGIPPGQPPSIRHIANPEALVELLRWEANQYLQEQIITPRRHAAVVAHIGKILEPEQDKVALQRQLLVHSPLLDDILQDMRLLWAA